MYGLRKDPSNHGAVVLAQIGDDDLWVVALGPQGQQEGFSTGLVVVGIDGNVQQVVGPGVGRQVDVHPAPHFAGRLVILGHQHVLLIHAEHPADLTTPNKAAIGKSSTPQALTQRQAVRLATPRAVPVRR